jgi:hypothetical protein
LGENWAENQFQGSHPCENQLGKPKLRKGKPNRFSHENLNLVLKVLGFGKKRENGLGLGFRAALLLGETTKI